MNNRERTRIGSGARQGFSLVEAIAAISILAGFTALWLPVVSRQGVWRTNVRQEQFAMLTLQNFVEEIQSDPPREVTSAALQSQLQLSPESQKLFPEGRIESTVVAEPESQGDRIQLRLSWRGPQGLARPQVEFTFWIYSL